MLKGEFDQNNLCLEKKGANNQAFKIINKMYKVIAIILFVALLPTIEGGCYYSCNSCWFNNDASTCTSCGGNRD
jgi:hypothetical protein